MKNAVLLLIVLLLTDEAYSKNKKNPYFKQTTSEAGITISSNSKLNSLALSVNQYWGVGRKDRKFKIGLGARLTSSFGNKKINYSTASSDLTRGKTGVGGFFSKQISQNIDTLKLASTQVNALNLFLALRYDFKKKWGVEFNIDLAGFTFGGIQSSTLTYGEHSNATRVADARPSPRNALLIGDNDIGSLNSEIMVSYLYKPTIKVKIGAAFIFNEYKVDNPVLYTNSIGTVVGTDRYRSKSLAIGIGVNYIFKHKKQIS